MSFESGIFSLRMHLKLPNWRGLKGAFFMDARPPRFLIMVTLAVLIFIGAAALLILQSRAVKPSVEIAKWFKNMVYILSGSLQVSAFWQAFIWSFFLRSIAPSAPVSSRLFSSPGWLPGAAFWGLRRIFSPKYSSGFVWPFISFFSPQKRSLASSQKAPKILGLASLSSPFSRLYSSFSFFFQNVTPAGWSCERPHPDTPSSNCHLGRLAQIPRSIRSLSNALRKKRGLQRSRPLRI